LSNADPGVALAELARVAKVAHGVEECFERGKGEAGLTDHQVRNWSVRHHRQTLTLLAAWFLDREARRGKNPDPGADAAAIAITVRGADRGPPRCARCECPGFAEPPPHPLADAKRAGEVLSPPIT
jgi:hypothetical protein